MNRQELVKILEAVEVGKLSASEASELLSHFPYHNLEHTRLDTQRQCRTGFQEVIFAGQKSPDELIEISNTLFEKNRRVLITKLKKEHIDALRVRCQYLEIYERGGIAVVSEKQSESLGRLAVISAGTSDAPVVDEAEHSARFFGFEVIRINDVGIAGLSRVMTAIPQIESADIAIVIAGMEGALPGVICSLTSIPIIAVPTSVGYGVSFSGQTALYAMLVSCSSGMSVVNIDNGFGAAIAAARIARAGKYKNNK